METTKKIPGMTTCRVCGRDFPLLKENHYLAIDKATTGLSAVLGGSQPAMYDAMDCPHCGCQNVLQEFKRIATPKDLGACCCDAPGEEEEDDNG